MNSWIQHSCDLYKISIIAGETGVAEVEYTQARTTATRTSLMRAMEKLCAQKGVESVTVKAVIEEAGQKNESALQYHFKNRAGLISAIHKARMDQTQIKRRELLTESLATNSEPSVRELCELLVRPTFLLCRSDGGYRQWIKAFGLKNASVRHPMVEEDVLEGSTSVQMIANLLKEHLLNLDKHMFEDRYLTVVRFSGMSMANHAREKNAFLGSGSEVFFSNLVDLLTGIFTAEVSTQTRSALRKVK